MTDFDYTDTIERFSGFASEYDDVRPETPEALAGLLLPMAGCVKPKLVVDFGSGSGLSSRYWADHAESVIGIEPSDSMRQQAEQLGGRNITYRNAFSHATGLEDGCADVVNCGQSLHWMEPVSTFREAYRILRDGGVFAAYDFDWPPSTSSWKVDSTYVQCMKHIRQIESRHGTADNVLLLDKFGHLGRMQDSGRFRFTRECVLHQADQGNAERIVGVLLSQGCVQSLLKIGISEEDLHIDRLREAADNAFGSQTAPWYWSVRIRIGIK
ncbi:MAG: class I SAM-dependent methyltransferase [Planctomycetota bacterium]|jgi:SAM-dependent methyltransferase